MKKGIHPENYRLVVFKDVSNDYAFLSKSTAETKDTIIWEDGNEYPLVKLEKWLIQQDVSISLIPVTRKSKKGRNLQTKSLALKVRDFFLLHKAFLINLLP